MASEDSGYGLSPAIGHQTEENGSTSPDHTAELMNQLEENEDCKLNEAALIDSEELDSQHRRFLLSIVNWRGCKEKKVYNENVVSLEEIKRFKKDSVREDSLNRRILDSFVNQFVCEEETVDNENEKEISMAKTERFKKE